MTTRGAAMTGWMTLLCLTVSTLGQANSNDARAYELQRDIEYAVVDKQPLLLDLYLPQGKLQPVLVMWVHGGAWRAGSKDDMPLTDLVAAGYTVASVDYRLSTTAKFPAQVHDIKAAIRFLRSESERWKLSSKYVVIAGASAGAHLANVVGVTNGQQELEGTVGQHTKASSAVQGIVSFYGMSNLTTILAQSTPKGLQVRVPALELLLGGQPEKEVALAKLASPVFHIDKQDPPLLLFHGDQDLQAPINQSHELHGAYLKQRLPVQFEVVHGAAHGGEAFYTPERIDVVKAFLRNIAKEE